jgi:carboxyl-terminal processing protease
MNRRFQYAVVASSACLAIVLLFGAVRGSSAAADNPYTQLGVYSEVLSRIKADYVEEPDIKSVTLGAINGMLEALDPFASYLDAEQFKKYQQAKASPKPEVGLMLARRLGYIGIVDAIPGSPADKAGLTTGDVIESINNVSTRDMPLAFAEILLQGETGTQVEVSVLSVRQSDPQKVGLIRAPITYPAVTARLESARGEQVGVITAQSLLPGRVADVAAKVADLEKQGAKRLILDLRHCSTGPPEEGIALANLFMANGVITYTEGQKQSKQNFQATASKAITKLPLQVLINRGTAGAAEVAAAGLQDSKRAEVIGERTYGMAAVRRPVTMEDGSAVILAVAKYYSPSGKAIQDSGVTPAVQVAEVQAAAEADDDPRYQKGPADKPGEDPVLKRALDQQRAQPIITPAKP